MSTKEEIKITECFACGFKTQCQLYTNSNPTHKGSRDMWFCDICANTYIGNTHEYHFPEHDQELFRTIGYVTNTILEAINKKEDQHKKDKEFYKDAYVELEKRHAEEIKHLKERDEELTALEAFGVDNWIGYSEAIDSLENKENE